MKWNVVNTWSNARRFPSVNRQMTECVKFKRIITPVTIPNNSTLIMECTDLPRQHWNSFILKIALNCKMVLLMQRLVLVFIIHKKIGVGRWVLLFKITEKSNVLEDYVVAKQLISRDLPLKLVLFCSSPTTTSNAFASKTEQTNIKNIFSSSAISIPIYFCRNSISLPCCEPRWDFRVLTTSWSSSSSNNDLKGVKQFCMLSGSWSLDWELDNLRCCKRLHSCLWISVFGQPFEQIVNGHFGHLVILFFLKSKFVLYLFCFTFIENYKNEAKLLIFTFKFNQCRFWSEEMFCSN